MHIKKLFSCATAGCGLIALLIWLPLIPRAASPADPAAVVLLHSSLDSVAAITSPATGLGGTTTLAPADFVPAQTGNGAQFVGGGKVVAFPAAQNVELDRGEVEFWYHPNYDTAIGDTPHALLVIGDYYGAPHLTLMDYDDLSLTLRLADWSTRSVATAWGALQWHAGDWVHIRAAWDTSQPDSLQLYVNGARVDTAGAAGGWSLGDETAIGRIFAGSANDAGDFVADGIIDELIVRDQPQPPPPVTATPTATRTRTATPTATRTATRTITPTSASTLASTSTSTPAALILTVRDTAGIGRTGEVVRSGVPLPAGLDVRDPAALTLVDAYDRPVPAEFEALARWDAGLAADAPIQWLLVTFAATVPAHGSITYRLVTDGSAGPNPPPAGPISLTQAGNQVTVHTGPAIFRLGGDVGALFDEIRLADGTTLVSGSALTATVTNTLTAVTATRRVVIEHAGPLAAIVVVEGAYDLPSVGGGGLGDRRRYVFTAGSPVAIVRHAVAWEGDRCGAGVLTCDGALNGLRVERVRDALTLSADLSPDPSPRRGGEFASPLPSQGRGAGGERFVTAVGAFDAPAITGPVAPGQAAAIRQRLRAARTDPLAFEMSIPGTAGATGGKADGGMLAVDGTAGTVAVALDHMHRYEPQALRLTEDGRLAIDIADDSAWLGGRQGLFATFAVAALPAVISRGDLDRLLWAPLNRPLRGWPSPTWFAASDAVDELPVGGLPAELASYDALVSGVLTRTLERADANGLAGLMTFGVYPRYWGDPVYGDELDCGENDPTPGDDWDDLYWCATWTDYHNTIATAPVWAMRSGQVAWLDEIAAPGALRTLHTQIMQCAPGDDWFYCGQAPTGYGGYRADFNSSHAYFDNLFLYYWLTGDHTVIETLQRGASTMRAYLCSRRPTEPCQASDPPADEWAGLSGRVASQWLAAFRFVGLAGDDPSYLDDYRSGLARAVTWHYVEAEAPSGEQGREGAGEQGSVTWHYGGPAYGFWLDGVVTGPGAYSTGQLWMASLYDMNNLYRLQRDTGDAPIGEPAIPPSQVIAAWARTLVTFGATTAGDGTAGGRWPNALTFAWEGARIGGSLITVTANTSIGDPYLWDTGKAALPATLLRAGDATGDPSLAQMAADLTQLALAAALRDGSPLGKVQGLYLERLGPAVARLAARSAPACRADVTADGVVDAGDRQAVVAWWRRTNYPPVADQDGSGAVDVWDIQAVIGQAGQGCAGER